MTPVVDALIVLVAPAILWEKLDALGHVEFGNKDCIKADINKLCIWSFGRVGHSSSLVVLTHIAQAELGGRLGIQAAASSTVNPNVSIAL